MRHTSVRRAIQEVRLGSPAVADSVPGGWRQPPAQAGLTRINKLFGSVQSLQTPLLRELNIPGFLKDPEQPGSCMIDD